jgi:hypothetical protein
MSLIDGFAAAATPRPKASRKPRKRTPPFSLRLNEEEKTRLVAEANGTPLGTYIKAKAMGAPLRARRSGLAVEDRKALAQALALLGQSRISSNLNQLAHAANVGVLPVTLETEEALMEACAEVSDIRRLLMSALGLKPERAP